MKRVLLYIFAVAFSMFLLVGCKSQNNETQETTSQEISTTEVSNNDADKDDIGDTDNNDHINETSSPQIVVDDTYMDVDLGEWEDMEARYVDGKNQSTDLTFKVHDQKIVKVSGGKVYGKKLGETKITISSNTNKKIKKVVYIRVEKDD
ncbi:MAG: hypothetical protein PHT76_11195 [Anaerostipes sp.]|nr:hypothetical protein [Anaerostipes sp.]